MKTWSDLKEEVLASFDFRKVKKAMDALDWKYNDCQRVPKKKELRETAGRLIDDVIAQVKQETDANPEITLGTGGFEVQAWMGWHGPTLSLVFQLEEFTSYANE